MNRWNWIDKITWATQPTESQAFDAWLSCHDCLVAKYAPQIGKCPPATDTIAVKQWKARLRALLVNHYSGCSDIKAFQASTTGKAIAWIYSFNTRLLDFLKDPDRHIRFKLWQISWEWRCSLVRAGYYQSTLDTPTAKHRERQQQQQRDLRRAKTEKIKAME